MDILAALMQEEAKLQKQLTGVRGAIVALDGARTIATGGRAKRVKKTGTKRAMSAALRARLSRLAKERWAKIKAGKQKGKKAA